MFAGHISLQLAHLRMEHQVNRFMGCDYNIEFVFRVLKHLLATEACQAHSEDAYYGHWVLRLIASFVLFYTSRVICKGRLTMEEIIFSLKHYWRGSSTPNRGAVKL
jgi:hypothetical protein